MKIFFFLTLYYKKIFFFITVIFLNNKLFTNISTKLILFSKSTFTDITVIEHLPKIKGKKNFYINILYNYIFKNYLIYLFLSTNYFSLYPYYKSTLWLEREVREFYNLNLLELTDNRNLLLDYNKQYYPLKKQFPVTGFEEIFFNFLNFNISYTTTTSIEL